jgi:Cu/Zn superoxide dismutase
VSLQVSGLTADTEYPAHVHALPCDMAGGGHYKLDPAIEDTAEDNELWPAFTTDADGNAVASVTDAHVARADAMSVVIHDPEADNAKMLCADLIPTGFDTGELTGRVAPFGAAEATDESITGTATLTRSDSGTTATLDLAGLSADAEYIAHVHALPCGVGDAGGHYKLDPTVEDVAEENELWLEPTPGDGGDASVTITSDHLARPDAQSVVVHRRTTDAAPKVACADLAPATPATYVTSGEAMLFDAATDAGLGDMAASAELKRMPDGTTGASIEVSGLEASTEYGIHVHDRDCSTASGGGHYKIDPTVEDALEDNELWLTLTTDENGDGSQETSVAHVARAEAQAIVIHGAEGVRLACIDLR